MTEDSFTASQLFGLVIFPAFMIAAALCDLTTLKIPNKLSAALVIAFAPAAALAHLSWASAGLHAAVAAAALVLGILAFSMRWIGSGDGKFLAACALWFGPEDILSYAIAFSLAGGALALFLLSARQVPLPAMLARRSWLLRLWDRASGLPYALAFAAGGLAVYPHSDIWQRLIAG